MCDSPKMNYVLMNFPAYGSRPPFDCEVDYASVMFGSEHLVPLPYTLRIGSDQAAGEVSMSGTVASPNPWLPMA